MPGRGQGKQAQKKKWHENVSKIAPPEILAIHTIDATMFPTLETANDRTKTTCVNTATAASSSNTNNALQHQTYYTQDEVEALIAEARVEGWEEGVEEGYKMGKKMGLEERQREGEAS